MRIGGQPLIYLPKAKCLVQVGIHLPLPQAGFDWRNSLTHLKVTVDEIMHTHCCGGGPLISTILCLVWLETGYYNLWVSEITHMLTSIHALASAAS